MLGAFGFALVVLVMRRSRRARKTKDTAPFLEAAEEIARGVFAAAILAFAVAFAQDRLERKTKQESVQETRRALQYDLAQQDKLAGTALPDQKLEGFDLAGKDLTRANLAGAHLNGANLQDTTLVEADLRGAELNRAMLTRADLTGAQLSGAEMDGARLFSTTLTDACLTSGSRERRRPNGTVERVSLRPAKLNGANLAGAELQRANLFGVELNNAVFEEDLRAARNLPPGLRDKLRGKPRGGWPTPNAVAPDGLEPPKPPDTDRLKGATFSEKLYDARIASVEDGDTVSVRVSSIPSVLRPTGGEGVGRAHLLKLRLAGIQAPGRGEGGAGTSWNSLSDKLPKDSRVKFQQLGLEDRFARVYAFLYSDDKGRTQRRVDPDRSINMQLVREGNARSTLHEYDVPRSLAEDFFTAEREAQREGSNVWTRCPTKYPFGPGG